MALEQAQQQFAAAARIGYESRPLNPFYGLSQGGRAIAAGSARLGQDSGQQWQATGHGLKYDVSIPWGVLETPIKQDGKTRDIFSRVSLAIGSPLDFDSLKFGAAMNHIVDYTMAFQEPETYDRPIMDVQTYLVQPRTFPLELEIRVPGLSDHGDATAEKIGELLAVYPAISGLEIALREDGGVRWSHNEGRCFLKIPNEDFLKSGNTDGSATLIGAADYRRQAVLLPRAGCSQDALVPIMSWWIVLYALSMLARYAPSEWTKALSLTDSPIASRIEFLLDSALEAVPELLWCELNRLTGD